MVEGERCEDGVWSDVFIPAAPVSKAPCEWSVFGAHNTMLPSVLSESETASGSLDFQGREPATPGMGGWGLF